MLNLDILPFLGLECRIENYDYVDTLVGITLGPLIFLVCLVSLFGLEVAFRYSTIFEYFQCASFEEVEPAVSYLVRDYSLNCASSRYKSYVAYALAMLFVYPLG